ncbi:hypothetical protein NQ317_007658 [Molorchus minor]|uniref:Cartilage oligomeric matrix protein n=1 Tax=Molorchus minor TaxID=1323400 RepID=A0ABQ9JRZ5_9CUCU|nr:hypothetical protein NQ317_007658 [Molorchus minor]
MPLSGGSRLPCPNVSKQLEEVIKKDDFVLSLNHIKPKKRSRVAETLFSAEFPGAEHKFSIQLDRKTKRVVVETLEDGRKRSQHFTVDFLHDDSIIKSLILDVNQTQPGAHATLYIDCTSYGLVATPKSMRDMFSSKRDPQIEVFHERKNPLEIEGNRNVRMVLNRNGCPLSLEKDETGVSKVFDDIFRDDFLNNELRDDPYAFRHPETTTHRGDIPLLSDFDDGKIFEAINRLIAVVNLEVKRCEETTRSLNDLRRLLMECDICNKSPSTPTCATNPPRCYPGVSCYDTPEGPRCGPCPGGYSGDGYHCTRFVTCSENPCFTNVECRDTAEGAWCGSCPSGYTGNGFTCSPSVPTCEERNPCFPGAECRNTAGGPECGRCPSGYTGNGYSCNRFPTCRDQNPCFPGVECRDTAQGPDCGPCPRDYEGDGRYCKKKPTVENLCKMNPCAPGVTCTPTTDHPYFRCLGCPPGFTGNGTRCNDIDECDLVKPCDQRVTCTNLVPGYRCDPCPPGFTGSSGVQGVGAEFAYRHRQLCEDINECDQENICGSHSTCINTDGSYRCGPCPSGFTGDPRVGCQPLEGYCPNGIRCARHAQCDHGVGVNINASAPQDTPETARHAAGTGISTDGLMFAYRDNCVGVPNSGQEDADGDGYGDACDDDADGDGVRNGDNCPLHPNPGQEDSEDNGGDKVGDVCDNCRFVKNPDQGDIDQDGIGDACDDDMDGDGILNRDDNCIRISNLLQTDTDRDGIGDACDNCPQMYNPEQEDSNENAIGDVCDSPIDTDKDGVPDEHDNCRTVPNPDQHDADGDEQGDYCDDDLDGDGFPNNRDNCDLMYNPDQIDLDGNGVGDVCQLNRDNDTKLDIDDVCPNNSLIYQTDFSKYTTVILDPIGESQVDPKWEIYNHGAEILQTINSDPGLAVGYDKFYGVDFEGTFFVDTEIDDDYVGFIFSYQSNQKFYTVMWKKQAQAYWHQTPFYAYAEPGIQIKVVDSETGPGEMLRNSLWHTGDTPGQVRTLWTDPKNVGWKERISYRWFLMHRPHIGLIRLKIFQGDKLVTDSGNIFDKTHQGGQLGVFCFSQEMIIWSDLVYRCNDNVREEVYWELPVELRRLIDIDNTRSFSIVSSPIS